MDPAVLQVLLGQRGPSSTSRTRLQSRQFPSHVGDPRSDQGLVADEPQGKADQDRGEGRKPRPLCRLPYGGSSDPKKPLRRRPAAHRRTATAASHVNSMRRSVSRVRQNPQEKCVLIAKSSALSTFDLASACLGAVRRRAGGSQADGSSLPRARCGRTLDLKPGAIRRMSVKEIHLPEGGQVGVAVIAGLYFGRECSSRWLFRRGLTNL
jgi:hypothetical protein